jgi:hypothetical protein
MESPSHLDRIAQLEARVAALEAALQRRSLQLRQIQQAVCPQDLGLVARILEASDAVAGGAFDPAFLLEGPHLRPVDVAEALDELWRRSAPPRDGGDG